jgi:hypothetical protein
VLEHYTEVKIGLRRALAIKSQTTNKLVGLEGAGRVPEPLWCFCYTLSRSIGTFVRLS